MRNIFKTSLFIFACLWNHALMAQTSETFTFAWTSNGTAGYCYSQSGPTGGGLLLNNKVYFTSKEGPKADASHLNPYKVGFVFCPTHDVTLSWNVGAGSSARDFNMRIDTIVNAYFYNAFVNAAGSKMTMAAYVAANADNTEKEWWQTATNNKVITSKGAAGTDDASKEWFSGMKTGEDVAKEMENADKVSVPKNKDSVAVVAVKKTGYVFKANTWYRICTVMSSSSGGHMTALTFTSSAPIISTDATLSDLKVDGTTIAGFDPNTTTYNYSVAATATTAPVLSATKNDSKASDPVITQPTMPTVSNPTVGTVQVTAEDGTTTKTYTVNFTRAELSHDATLSDIKVDGKSVSGFSSNNTSYTVNIPFSQTAIPVVTATTTHAEANAVITAASVVEGTATIVVTAEDGSTTMTYTLTFQKVTASTDATLSSLSYNGQPVSGFSSNKTSYSVELPEGSFVPTVNATTTHPFATFVVQQATSTSGTATITVTAEDGATTMTYTIQFSESVGPQMPQTSLTLHEPGVYEAKALAGGYGTNLTVYDNREYEVYYCFKGKKDGSSFAAVATTPSGTSIADDNQKALDGWFEADPGSMEEKGASAMEEFAAGTGNWKMKGQSLKLHVKGYDLFKILAADNDTKNPEKRFNVYINNVEQTSTFSTSPSTRSYPLSPGKEYLIEVKAGSSTQIKLYGFSLREAQVPQLKYLKGNDSTQVVMQTAALRPITYITKYNNIQGAHTELIWEGQEATGIDFNVIPGELTDTIVVGGTANCATGVYKYAVVSYYNSMETSRATGTFTVKSDIQATSDTKIKVYNGEEMDQITFKYYALSADDVLLTWPNGQPNGISGSGDNGKYIIGGTPQITGTFPQTFSYSITVTGSETTIQGQITIDKLEYGENSVLYLYKNSEAYKNDGVYTYIENAGKWNLIARKQKENGLRPADQYANYKWILISEDVDADNTEVLGVIRGEANLPVLNLKGFAYSFDRLGWGEPDNGAIDTTAQKSNGCKLYVQHPDHPIYQAKMNYLKAGDSIQVLSNYTLKGLMPINIDVPESYCLGTAYTRNIDDYYGRGEKQTALHEIPAAKHNGQKYICLPLAREVTLASQGQQLIEGIITYLTSESEPGITLPELKINTFSVLGVDAKINQNENTILLSIPQEMYDSLETAEPVITLADQNTHVNTNSTSLMYAVYIPKTYVVTDYINRRAYSLTVEVYAPQGIDEVYAAGMWVNVFDIYGRKVATTNEDIYTMDLPKGMYIIVTESGQTLKIMR